MKARRRKPIPDLRGEVRTLVKAAGAGGATIDGLVAALGERGFGRLSLYSAEDPNVLFWIGLSQELVDALVALRGAGELHLEVADPARYLRVPALPIAQAHPEGGWDRKVWMPVVVRQGPPPGAPGRLRAKRRRPST